MSADHLELLAIFNKKVNYKRISRVLIPFRLSLKGKPLCYTLSKHQTIYKCNE